MSADLVIVGARCAGSPLATHLARAGFDVCLVDRARFPSDTVSSHLFQVSATDCLRRLGVMGEIEATGAPCLEELRVCHDGIDMTCRVEPRGRLLGGYSIHRNVLDDILVRSAVSAGVNVLTGWRVVGLEQESGRVTGVRIVEGERQAVVSAALVVGADGRSSTVARLMGARMYNVTENERFAFWADYVGVPLDGPGRLYYFRNGPDVTIGAFCDDDRFTVMVEPELGGYQAFRLDPCRNFDAAVRRCQQMAPVLASAQRVTDPVGTSSMRGFFRETAGAGWVVVGDAGHFKDPILGQGIADALRQSERLAAVVSRVGLSDPRRLDRALRAWWRWRDADAAAMYWLVWDTGRAGALRPLERRILSDVAADPRLRQLLVDYVTAHQHPPRRVLTLRRALVSTLRAVADGDAPAGALLRELRDRAVVELQRRWWERRPRYVSPP
jgi:menaquinone-9 beta-reductase